MSEVNGGIKTTDVETQSEVNHFSLLFSAISKHVSIR